MENEDWRKKEKDKEDERAVETKQDLNINPSDFNSDSVRISIPSRSNPTAAAAATATNKKDKQSIETFVGTTALASLRDPNQRGLELALNQVKHPLIVRISLRSTSASFDVNDRTAALRASNDSKGICDLNNDSKDISPFYEQAKQEETDIIALRQCGKTALRSIHFLHLEDEELQENDEDVSADNESFFSNSMETSLFSRPLF